MKDLKYLSATFFYRTRFTILLLSEKVFSIVKFSSWIITTQFWRRGPGIDKWGVQRWQLPIVSSITVGMSCFGLLCDLGRYTCLAWIGLAQQPRSIDRGIDRAKTHNSKHQPIPKIHNESQLRSDIHQKWYAFDKSLKSPFQNYLSSEHYWLYRICAHESLTHSIDFFASS